MHILFSPHSDDHATLQHHALELGSKLTTEDAIRRELGQLTTATRWIKFTKVVGGYSLLLGPLFFVLMGFKATTLIPLALTAGTLGWFSASLAASQVETFYQLCQLIEARPDLCAELFHLSEQSAAVRKYLHEINESGRSLRVFDIAFANKARQAELKSVARMSTAENVSHLQSL